MFNKKEEEPSKTLSERKSEWLKKTFWAAARKEPWAATKLYWRKKFCKDKPTKMEVAKLLIKTKFNK